MSTWRTARILMGNDWRLFLRDKTGMTLGFLLPIALVAVFGYVMNFAFGGPGGMPRVTLWVADEDGTDASRGLVERLREVDVLSVRPRGDEEPLGGEELRKKVADGEATHGLLVGSGFGEDLAAGRLPDFVLVRDPGRELEDQMVRIGLMQAFFAATEGRLWPAAMGRWMRERGMTDDQVDRLVGSAQAMQAVIRSFVGEGESSPNARPAGSTDPGAPVGDGAESDFDMRDFLSGMVPVTEEDVVPPDRPRMLSYQLAQSVSGVTVMMLMFGIVACSSTLLAERESGTLRRLWLAPAPRESVLLGKFLFTVVVGILQLLVLFSTGEVLFGVGAFRDPLTLAILSVTWAACATSFGMLIAAWARTRKQAEGLSTLLILVMAALGGCWFPVQLAELPWIGEVVTRLTLTWWAMTGYQGMFWHQWSFTHPTMLQALGVQWMLAIALGALAVWQFRRNYLAG